MKEQYAIIAGTNKAGTTSLFRYLSAHPEICPSTRKELDFFSDPFTSDPQASQREYTRYFKSTSKDQWCKLEASPNYIAGGEEMAARIKRALPEARLIFLLREPASRIASFFTSNNQNRFNKGVAELTFSEFTKILEDVHDADGTSLPNGPKKNAFNQFNRGAYARQIEGFLKHFPANQVHVDFFDNLKSDTRDSVKAVAKFLGINESFYDGFTFIAENKTREARLPHFLHGPAVTINRRLEPFLNRIPSLRALGRTLLFREPTDKKPLIKDSELNRIRDIYQEENNLLIRLIREKFPCTKIPEWLQDSNKSARAP